MAGKATNLIALGTALGATALARKLVDATWKLGAGKRPPSDPSDPDVNLNEALLWAVISGAAIGVAKMWAARHLARNARRQRQRAAAKALRG
jgi:hypothetical protein